MQFSYDDVGLSEVLAALEGAERRVGSAQRGAARGWQLTEAGAGRMQGVVAGASRRSVGRVAGEAESMRQLVSAVRSAMASYEVAEQRAGVMCGA